MDKLISLTLAKAIKFGLFLLVLPVPGRADFTYTTNNSTITITGYTGPGGSVAIPEVINGLPVKRIDHFAFWQQSSVYEVILPDSITQLGNSTFNSCVGLTNIVFGNGLTNIGGNTFSRCSGLRQLVLPPALGNLGSHMFSYCTNLATIDFGGALTNTGEFAFAYCTGLTNLMLPASLKTLGAGAFVGCVGLGSVMVASNLTSIGTAAFAGCTTLTNISLSEGLVSIGLNTFYSCSNLVRINIPASVTSIADGAFGDCASLNAIFFRGNAPQVGGSGFSGDKDSQLFATAYYLPGTIGWTSMIGGVPARLWNPSLQTGDSNFGFHTNHFGFTITGTVNIPIVVEASSNLTGAPWIPLQTGLLTNGLIYFRDLQWTNHPLRLYRIGAP